MRLIIGALLGVFLSITSGFYLYHENDLLWKEHLDQARVATNIAFSVLQKYEKRTHLPINNYFYLTEEDAQKRAKEILRAVSYNNSAGYIFIMNSNGQFILNGANTDLEAKEFNGQDYNGDRLASKILAATESGSFIWYHWLQPGTQNISEKVSMVQRFAPWNWYVGSGTYIDEVANNSFWLGIQGFILLSLILSVLIFNFLYTKNKKFISEKENLLNKITFITENSNIGIWELDIANGDLVWDNVMFRLHDMPEALFNKKLLDWHLRILPEDEAFFDNIHKPTDRIIRVIRGDGTIACLHVASTVNDKKILGAAWDVTEQQKVLQETEAVWALAEKSSRTKSRFLSMMSHTLRTPLNAVIGFSELLQSIESDCYKLEKIKIISESSRNLLGTIDSILEFSRVETGNISVKEENFCVAEETKNVIDLFTKSLVKNVQIEYVCEPLDVFGKKSIFTRVLTNIITNTCKHTDSGHINISIKEQARVYNSVTVLCTVKNVGKGVSNMQNIDIFENYNNDTDTDTDIHDLCLGMSILKQLVTLLNGIIWFDVLEEEVSCFFFTAEFKDQT